MMVLRSGVAPLVYVGFTRSQPHHFSEPSCSDLNPTSTRRY